MPKVLPTATSYLEVGNPLPRAVCILVILVELAVRAIAGQEGREAWSLPLLHGLLAWLALSLYVRLTDHLFARLCMPKPSSRPIPPRCG